MNNLVKKELLRRKINEIFKEKDTSKVIRCSLNGENVYWSVKREGKGFKIVEITTKKEEFSIFQEASPAFTQLSRTYTDAMASMVGMEPGFSDELKQASDRVDSLSRRIEDPVEKVASSKMAASIAAASGEAQKGIGSDTTDTLKQKFSMSATTEAKSLKEQPARNEPGDDIGLEKDVEDVASASPQDIPGDITMEQALMAQVLKGQTIESAEYSSSDESMSVVLKVAGMENPVMFEYKGRKLVFWFKGRPYVLDEK